MKETTRPVYRLCPCFALDVEGIQTWLEDLALEGLHLDADGGFMGIFRFRRGAPRKVRYRMVPVKEPQGFFSDMAEEPDAEERAFTAHCGWEYLLRYGSFFLYRAEDPQARPLHTDPAIHAMSMAALKKQKNRTVLSLGVYLLLMSLLGRTPILSVFRSGATFGLLYLLSITGLLAWLLLGSGADFLRLHRYQKRLLAGDSLETRRDWRPGAWLRRCLRFAPLALILLYFCSLGSALFKTVDRLPLEQLPTALPFATLSDTFPDTPLDRQNTMGDYGTGLMYQTALSENYEWNETADLTYQGQPYYALLRLQHHDTFSSWWAKGLFRDYYTYEAQRYRGKRFELLEAPQTPFDEIRVFRSYGILHILIRQGSSVTHAVVDISGPEKAQHWQLWLEAMAQHRCED